MGTRADFYVSEEMKYLGSIAWDGDDIPDSILEAETTEEFKNKNGESMNIKFPDMSDIQNVTLGKRSGVVVLHTK